MREEEGKERGKEERLAVVGREGGEKAYSNYASNHESIKTMTTHSVTQPQQKCNKKSY